MPPPPPLPLPRSDLIKHITILGGGLTGLTTAYRLAQVLQRHRADVKNQGAKRRYKRLDDEVGITLIEKSERLGGWVRSERRKVKLPISNGSSASTSSSVSTYSNGKIDVDLTAKEQRSAEKGNTDEVEVEVVLEKGPRSIRPRGSKGAAQMLKLLQSLSLTSSLLPVPHNHPSALNRYILDPRSHTLIRLPSSLKDVLTLAFRKDGSGRGKGMLKGFLRGVLGSLSKGKGKAKEGVNDMSVDALVRSTLGPRISDALISSMVHGIYATDSRLLSVRSSFPILWNALQSRSNLLFGLFFPPKKTAKELKVKEEEEAIWEGLGEVGRERKEWSVYGLRGGLEVITRRLVEECGRLGVEFRRGVGIDEVKVDGNGVSLDIDNSNESLSTSLVISTLTPKTLANILPSSSILPHLTHNPATTVGLVNLVFPTPPSQIHPPGFGYLVPRHTDSVFFPPDDQATNPNPDGIIGVVFDSTSVSGAEESPLATTHLTKLTIMMGGPHWSTYPSDRDPNSPPIAVPSEDELPEKAMKHLRKVFPGIPDPILAEAHIHYDCIPTYLVGHGQRLREMDEHIRNSEWRDKLVLTGSGYGGVGVNDCVGIAEDLVADLERRWAGEEVVTGLERWRGWK